MQGKGAAAYKKYAGFCLETQVCMHEQIASPYSPTATWSSTLLAFTCFLDHVLLICTHPLNSVQLCLGNHAKGLSNVGVRLAGGRLTCNTLKYVLLSRPSQTLSMKRASRTSSSNQGRLTASRLSTSSTRNNFFAVKNHWMRSFQSV